MKTLVRKRPAQNSLKTRRSSKKATEPSKPSFNDLPDLTDHFEIIERKGSRLIVKLKKPME